VGNRLVLLLRGVSSVRLSLWLTLGDAALWLQRLSLVRRFNEKKFYESMKHHEKVSNLKNVRKPRKVG